MPDRLRAVGFLVPVQRAGLLRLVATPFACAGAIPVNLDSSLVLTMSALTFSWATQNLSPRQCRGCGRITEGWGRKTEPQHGYRDFGPHRIPAWDDSDYFALCSACGGTCCGDCRPGQCEFGLESGGPSACSPEFV